MLARLIIGLVLCVASAPSLTAAPLPLPPPAADLCVNAPPAANFTNAAYDGTWFEIAKYQTAGGAFFERDCVCTVVEVSPCVATIPPAHTMPLLLQVTRR